MDQAFGNKRSGPNGSSQHCLTRNSQCQITLSFVIAETQMGPLIARSKEPRQQMEWIDKAKLILSNIKCAFQLARAVSVTNGDTDDALWTVITFKFDRA